MLLTPFYSCVTGLTSSETSDKGPESEERAALQNESDTYDLLRDRAIPDDKAPFLAKEMFFSIWWSPRGKSIRDIIDLHLQPAFADPETISWISGCSMSFHMVFYMILDDDDNPYLYIGNRRYCYSQNEMWPMGNLYGKGKPIVQVACTVSCPSQEKKSSEHLNRFMLH